MSFQSRKGPLGLAVLGFLWTAYCMGALGLDALSIIKVSEEDKSIFTVIGPLAFAMAIMFMQSVDNAEFEDQIDQLSTEIRANMSTVHPPSQGSIDEELALLQVRLDELSRASLRECLMVCVWESFLHEEMNQNDYCGTTRPSR